MSNYNWLRWGGKLAFVVGLLSAASCAATRCADYRHLDFHETPGIAVIETGVPPLSGLRNVKPFPVSYALERRSYRILVRAYEKDYGPTAILSVEHAAKMNLKLVGTSASDASSCIVAVEQGASIKFSWIGAGGCAAEQHLRVAVEDLNGTRLGIEEIYFSVIKNGRYCVTDGL